MTEKRLPRSIRKFIRREKSRLRREVSDLKEREKKIAELYQRFLGKSKIKTEKSKKIDRV